MTDTSNTNLNARKYAYSPQVDPHIYAFQGHPDPQPGCQTPQDWVELALAALDQAGLSVRQTAKVKALIETFDYE